MAISDRITSIEEHIKESYQELEGIGIDTTGVNNNLENIPKLIDGYWETLPKVTGEGTSITLDNTKEGKMKIVLKGNTSQEGTPTPETPQDIHVVSGDNSIEVCGRNLGNPNTLFDEMYNSYVAKPIKTIVDNRNVINFSTYYSHNKPLYVTKYKENTQYTFRLVAKTADSTLRYLYIIVQYTDGTSSSASIPNQGTSWDELRIVSTANKTIKNFYFSYSNAGYWYIDEESFNIIEGDATNYEPYTGATYPLNLGVENILDITSSGSSIGGVPFTIENGIIKINGTTSSSTASYYFNTFRAKSESAVFSIEVTGYTDKSSGNSALILQQSDDGTTGWSTLSELSLNSVYAKQNSVTLDSSKYYRLRWYVDNNTFTNATIKAQLEYGNKKNSFTPYGTTPIELCKIGDYQDYFYKDNGKWYLNKQIGKVVLDGSESGWNKHGSIASWFYYDGIIDGYVLDNTQILIKTNYYTPKAYQGVPNLVNGECAYGTSDSGITHRFVIKNTDYTQTNDFKNWLSTHNTIVYYVLVTPTYTEITDSTLLSQLNALAKSYNNQTNISQENNDLASILNATALSE